MLPAQVVVREGSSLSNSDEYMATNESFNLHFLKSTKIAVITDPITNEKYSIPYSSSVKLGLIYSPSPDDENATPYMQLKTAGDVMKLKSLPLILTATTAYDGGAENKSVSESEVVFVKGIVKVSRAKQLQVMGLNGEEKFLAAKCAGCFSTDPRHTKLHPSKLFLHEFPMTQFVVVYPGDKEIGRSFPQSMSNKPVVLETLKRETSVIATCGDISDIESSKRVMSACIVAVQYNKLSICFLKKLV